MSDLVERYVHQVGRYLPKNERPDIEAELRSLIHDQLEDRFGGSPSEKDVAAVLKDLGDPRLMSAKYRKEQYLVGPDLYPYLMAAMRYVWVTVPVIVAFIRVFGALASPQPQPLPALLLDTLASAAYAAFICSALVVLVFAVSQQIIAEFAPKQDAFDPQALPSVDDPRTVDRYEAVFGVVIGVVAIVAFLYFLRVGGLTLRFSLTDPGEVIPVPAGWLAALIVAVAGMVGVQGRVLWRSRWTGALWLLETILELVGMICLYFVLYEPISQRIAATVPALADSALLQNAPEFIVIVSAIFAAAGRSGRLLKLWNTRDSTAPPVAGGASV